MKNAVKREGMRFKYEYIIYSHTLGFAGGNG